MRGARPEMLSKLLLPPTNLALEGLNYDTEQIRKIEAPLLAHVSM